MNTGSQANKKRGPTGGRALGEVDMHVGARIRLRRTLLGLSQMALGELVGVSFQQIQKYERGANRISAGTLHRLAEVLDTPISYFFDGFEDVDGLEGPPCPKSADPVDIVNDPQTVKLLRAWSKVPEYSREAALELLFAIGRTAAVIDGGQAASLHPVTDVSYPERRD